MLPNSMSYVPGRSQITSNNTVTVGIIDATRTAACGGRSASMNDIDNGSQVFEVTFKRPSARRSATLGRRRGQPA